MAASLQGCAVAAPLARKTSCPGNPVASRFVYAATLSASWVAERRPYGTRRKRSSDGPQLGRSVGPSRRLPPTPRRSIELRSGPDSQASTPRKDEQPPLSGSTAFEGNGALYGEDSAAFDLGRETVQSWGLFFGVLTTVLALLFALWISPDTGFGDDYIDLFKAISGNTQVQMALILLFFALIHSGGAALRAKAEQVIGPRAYRVLFAGVSLPLAVSAVVFFINHRYDGAVLWQLRGVPGMHDFVWGLSFLSFFFLYPSTFNLKEVAAVDQPQVHLWETGIIRITRHPQMVGQLMWCVAHTLWIGSSFTALTSLILLLHHAFGVWHGDQRLSDKYGSAFEEVKSRTSTVPFAAILEGRQKLPTDYYKEFLRVPYGVITVLTIGAYFAHPLMLRAAFWLHW